MPERKPRVPGTLGGCWAPRRCKAPRPPAGNLGLPAGGPCGKLSTVNDRVVSRREKLALAIRAGGARNRSPAVAWLALSLLLACDADSNQNDQNDTKAANKPTAVAKSPDPKPDPIAKPPGDKNPDPKVPPTATDKPDNKQPGTTPKVDGKALFMKKCKTCHGPKGDAKPKGKVHHKMPDWTKPGWKAKRPVSKIVEIVTAGVPDTKMKAFATKLSETEILAVSEFAHSLGQ